MAHGVESNVTGKMIYRTTFLGLNFVLIFVYTIKAFPVNKDV